MIPRYLTFKITLLDIYATLYYVLCLVKPRRSRVALYNDNKRGETELVIELLNVAHDSQYIWHPFGIDWDNRSASVGQLNCFNGTIELSRSSGTTKVSLWEIGLVSVRQSNCFNGTIDLSQWDNRIVSMWKLIRLSWRIELSQSDNQSVSVRQSVCLSGT